MSPWLFFSAILLSTCAWADEPSESGKVSRSWVPIAGYNPTYRTFAGGGYFISQKEDDGHFEFGIHTIAASSAVAKVQIDSNIFWAGNKSLDASIEGGYGFEPNYGSGGQTLSTNRVDVPMIKLAAQVRAGFHPSPQFRLGPVIDVQLRRNRAWTDEAAHQAEIDPIPSRESTLAIGVFQEIDYRDVKENPQLGWYENASMRWVPEGLSDQSSSVALLDAEIRLYQNLLAKDLVIAYLVAGGLSFGSPSFAMQYKLGGTDRLRGYYLNRFRGGRYYLQQTEARFPIYKMVRGATFLEFGETAVTTGFTGPSACYGAGLRIALPPDYVSQIRIDYARGRDQSGVFFDFGHAF